MLRKNYRSKLGMQNSSRTPPLQTSLKRAPVTEAISHPLRRVPKPSEVFGVRSASVSRWAGGGPTGPHLADGLNNDILSRLAA